MEILEVYKKYKIMPQLADHQFRVAAVASIISGKLVELGVFSGQQKADVVLACLLHDMGNIIKFDFAQTVSLVNTGIDLDYWQKVKTEYISIYGKDEHSATIQIVKELGVEKRIEELVDCVGFNQAESNLNSGDLGKQICAYADMRVTPRGVASLEERFADLRSRYEAKRLAVGGTENDRLKFEQLLREIEKQIFTTTKTLPEYITEESLAPVVIELKKYKF
ncbi:MAG: hypothetical protein JNN11_00095 [Candidatus Doudnabacteria bacterium]|nr:hypothetical protein [Candidatus Doudnabacteria bacterium]